MQKMIVPTLEVGEQRGQVSHWMHLTIMVGFEYRNQT